jgi:hypothetical protein
MEDTTNEYRIDRETRREAHLGDFEENGRILLKCVLK